MCRWRFAKFAPMAHRGRERESLAKKGCQRMKKRGIKYSKDLPRFLYGFFNSWQDTGLPSFDKFARSIGTTAEALREMRKHSEFDRAWRECIEIRRDYLIDAALTRRFDPSFAKFLITEEAGGEEAGESLAVSITVEE